MPPSLLAKVRTVLFTGSLITRTLQASAVVCDGSCSNSTLRSKTGLGAEKAGFVVPAWLRPLKDATKGFFRARACARFRRFAKLGALSCLPARLPNSLSH